MLYDAVCKWIVHYSSRTSQIVGLGTRGQTTHVKTGIAPINEMEMFYETDGSGELERLGRSSDAGETFPI